MDGAPDEFDLIARLFAPLTRGHPGAFDLTDDAALLAGEVGTDTVVTVDAIVAGIHFLPDDPPRAIAAKLLRVNLSDLAAKGAEPVAAVMAAAFPRDLPAGWLEDFAAGLGADLDRYGVALVGGDTVSTPGPLTLSLTAFGRVPAGAMLRRAGGLAGDTVWVSGTLGDAALGLRVLKGDFPHLAAADRDHLTERYRLPQPRVELACGLRAMAHAAMDVSDGLVQDLGHLCRVSGVGAVVEAAALPLSAAAGSLLAVDETALASVLAGGDDYEVLFAAPADAEASVVALAAATGIRLTPIGRLVEGAGVRVLDGSANPIDVGKGGWRHFQD
ncbi:thiamine-phosphate kinase [Magnetospirillum sp. UT-4]|uniref:thiamine-phosphate kinase n=1 Tax=Magnetospirillum sp. UT-4 TaxID=2681467 RepID=UPI00137E568C|nr:thiamine-phosphate kinase [Magnetospirillum sp. UT-4]CAA7617819.1 Thiamine-monophosphate kinase [Magnetospirillum sp. UT-4]